MNKKKINATKSTDAGRMAEGKSILSVSIDKKLKTSLSTYCAQKRLKISPIIQDLIAQYMESVK